MPWLSGFSYRKSHIVNQQAGAGTDYQIKIKVHYDEYTSIFIFEKDDVNNPLTIPMYGATGVVHPDVLYFPDGIDGYKYWMVYTPYPPQGLENPCIIRSNDGINWTDAGIVNPVIPKPLAVTHQCDPDMIYVSDYSKWFMVWGRNAAAPDGGYCLAYSSDGKNWTEYDGVPVGGLTNPVIINVGVSGCGTLIYEDGVFYLFTVGGVGVTNREKLYLTTFTWNNVTDDVENWTPINGGAEIFYPSADSQFKSGLGHIDVSYHNGYYYLYACRELSGEASHELSLFTSTDKITWTNQGKVLPRGSSGDWDDQHIYRSSIVTDGVGNTIDFSGSIKLYYSGYTGGIPEIGIATGLSLGEVSLNTRCRTDFGDIRFTDNDETTELDYWIEEKVDSDYAIIWVKVDDDLGAGDVTIYIYYDNPTATYPHGADQTEMDATFIFADHFYGDILDAGKWNNSGAGIAVGGSEVTITNVNWIRSVNTYNQLLAFHAKSKSTAVGARLMQITDVAYNNYLNYYWFDAVQFTWSLVKAGVSAGSLHGAVDTIYHKHEARRIDGNLAIFYFDEILLQRYTDLTHIPIINLYFEMSRWLGGILTADYIFVRKVIDPEPVHGAWGVEEFGGVCSDHDNQTDCEANDCYWYDGTCHSTPAPLVGEVEVVKGELISKPWVYEYVWKHIPSEKVRAIIKRFNFGETKTIKGSFTILFTETKKLRARIANKFSESIKKDTEFNYPFEETIKLAMTPIIILFTETNLVKAVVKSKWFVERFRIFAETENLERNILDKLREIEEDE